MPILAEGLHKCFFEYREVMAKYKKPMNEITTNIFDENILSLNKFK